MRKVANVIEEKYLGQLPLILGAIVLFVVAAAMAGAMFYTRMARPTTPPVSQTATVIVFETLDCDACDDFRRTVGRAYRTSTTGGKAPMRYYDVTDGQPPTRFGLRGEIWTSPTVVVFDVFGREVARINGAPATLVAMEKVVLPQVRRAEKDIAYVTSANR